MNTQSIAAYGKARDLMVLAMRNALTAGTYTTYQPFIDPTVLADPLGSPTCSSRANFKYVPRYHC